MQPPLSAFDATYAARYGDRNAEKVERVVSRMDNPGSLLDLGCNAGYIDAEALEKFPNVDCHGVDLDRSVVADGLMNDARFRFTETDVVKFEFERTYDTVVFNAVLHHVLGKYGSETAFALWTRIIDHCEHELFFETGIAAETSKYIDYWKRAILRELGSDEAYYSELIRRIGPRLRKMEVVAELPIHKAVRKLHRFELYPLGSERDLKANPPRAYQEGLLDGGRFEVEAEFRRTEGSRRQKLVNVSRGAAGKARLHHGTRFFHLREKETGKSWFAKKIVGDPYKPMREFQIHQQARHPRIVPCAGVTEEFGLVFPRVDGKQLPQVNWSKIINREDVAGEITEFFEQVADLSFSPGQLDIDPLAGVASRSLIDTIDLHANNFLLQQEGSRIVDWRVIDLEHYSNTNRERNQRHQRQMLEMIQSPRQASWWRRLAPARP